MNPEPLQEELLLPVDNVVQFPRRPHDGSAVELFLFRFTAAGHRAHVIAAFTDREMAARWNGAESPEPLCQQRGGDRAWVELGELPTCGTCVEMLRRLALQERLSVPAALVVPGEQDLDAWVSACPHHDHGPQNRHTPGV